jgi:glutathione S-transferase
MRETSYARINPRHETPAFITSEDDVLTETMAIAAWIEARDAERRISFDPLSRNSDRMHQLMAFVNTGFTGAFSPLWAAMEIEPPNPPMQSVLRDWGRDAVIERHGKLTLQLHFSCGSESIGHHDSEVMDGRGIDRGNA